MLTKDATKEGLTLSRFEMKLSFDAGIKSRVRESSDFIQRREQNNLLF